MIGKAANDNGGYPQFPLNPQIRTLAFFEQRDRENYTFGMLDTFVMQPKCCGMRPSAAAAACSSRTAPAPRIPQKKPNPFRSV